MTWQAHWQITPCACVETPIRPCTAARGAAAIVRASSAIVAAGMPLAAAARSGVNASTAARTVSTPST